MTQNWKKLLSLLLVLTMLVGMMPAVFAAEEEPAAAPEQAEEILTEEPADPEVPAEPETPEEPAEPAEPEEPAPAAEEEAAPLTLKAAESLRLEDGKIFLVLTAENGAQEALTVRIAPKPAEGKAVAEDAWTEATVAPNETGEYLYEIAVAGLEAGDWVVEAACGEAVLTVEVSLVSDAEAEAVAVDGYTVTLPAPAEEEPVDAEEPADVVEEPAEPADEAGEPDLAGEPEDDAGFDIEIMSEAIDAWETGPLGTSVKTYSISLDTNRALLTVPFEFASAGTFYLIAESDTTRYYLSSVELGASETSGSFQDVPVPLPPGWYDFGIAKPDAASAVLQRNMSAWSLCVLPAPEAKLVGKSSVSGKSVISVRLPEDKYGIDTLRISGQLDLYEASVDTADMSADAVNGVYSHLLPDGDNYDLWYPGRIGYCAFYISSPRTAVSIPAATAPESLDAYFLTGDPGDPYIGKSVFDPLILRYKGATAQIETDFDTSVDDTRLTYKSSDKKVVTVDEVGNVTAVGAGHATILVTSMGDNPLAFDTVYVKVEPVTPKTFRFDQTKGLPDYGRKPEINDKYNSYSGLAPTYTLLLTTDSIPSDAQIPVTFTVTGGEGLKIFQGHADGAGHWPSAADNFANYKSTYTTTITTLGDPPRAQIHLMAVGGGHYTVTAEALGKTATCTIDVDGFSSVGYQAYPSDSAQFYRGGKTVTGWITWHGYEEQFIYGAGGLKPDPECGLAGRHIFYVSPSTKQVIGPGVQKIGSKYYCFDGSDYSRNSIQTCLYDLPDWHTVDGMDSTQNPYTGSLGYVYIAADGHLLTGWQEVDTDDDGLYDTVRYFDPSTYFMAENTWVPVRNGKGVTWVNEYGEQKDDNGNSLDNADTSPPQYQDGFHEISGEWYYFAGGYNKGARQTGWVYLTASLETGTSKNGFYKVYCDPAHDGRIATGTFRVSGKEYRGQDVFGISGLDAGIILPGPYALTYFGVKGVKYLSKDGCIMASDGSVVKNALVNACILGEFHTMYAKADGSIAIDEWVAVKGKSYYFDSWGCLPDGTVPIITPFYVHDEGSYSGVDAVPVKAGKPAEGYVYIHAGTKLTDILLYVKSGSSYIPTAVLDKSGKLAVNTAASARENLAEKTHYTFLANEESGVIRGYEQNYSGRSFKGRLYAVNRNGFVHAQAGLVRLGDNADDDYGFTDKNGILTCNAFASVKLNGKTYSVYFDEDGEDNPNWNVPVVKGKAYLTAHVTDTETGHGFAVVYKPATAGWETYDFGTSSHPMVKPVYVNKDGSLKTGFLTLPDGKKAYYTVRGGSTFYALGCWNQAPYPTLWKIDGKLYLFNEHKEQVTGWVHFDRVLISDLAADEAVTSCSDALIYFDPKTGAALAGGWKNAPLPLVYYDYDLEGYTLSFGAEDIGVPEEHGNVTRAVNAASKAAKLYFDADGVLARDTELTIGGKAYLFSHDGTSALKAGWTDANKMYYALKNGSLATGRQKIDGQYYCFDGAGRRVSNALLKTGSKWYYYDMNGVQATPVLSGSPPTSFKQAYIGSVDGTALTAVWAKDGALSKIVYTGSGKAAAGECVNFGSWDPSFDSYNVFCLDSKGLPMTGAVTVLEPDGSDYVSRTYLFNADGTRVRADSKDCNSLVLYGKQIYVMDGELVQTQSKLSAVIIDGSWDSLSDADRKTLDTYRDCYLGQDGDGDPSIWILVNPDGSVAGSRAIGATVDGRTRLWHTDRFGIPMEYYTPLFKFGGKWYWDAAVGSTMALNVPGEEGLLIGVVRTKSGGELVGVYSEQTGKAISGTFASNHPAGIVMLKNGKPQTGTATPAGGHNSYYLDPEMGLYPVNWC